MNRWHVSCCVMIMLLILFWGTARSLALTQSEASAALSTAEAASISAYVAVGEASAEGANTSELLRKMNVAADALSNAWNAYGLGNYDEAYNEAVNCSSQLDGIATNASDLRSRFQNANMQAFFLTVGVSIGGICVLAILSLLGWNYLKKRHLKKMLTMRPQIGGQA